MKLLNEAAETTLDGAIDATQTTLSINPVAGTPDASLVPFRIWLGAEMMIVTAVSGASDEDYTVIRHAEGTIASAHADDATVLYPLVPTGGPVTAAVAFELMTRAGTGGGGASADVLPIVDGFLLTLAAGHPIYAPQHFTPSATDTGTDIVTTAAAHGLVTGTIAGAFTTLAGLTRGTVYYLRAQSTTTLSFHTTLADAEADTSRVNLTASVTQRILVSGVASTTLRHIAHDGNQIALYNGSTAWAYFTGDVTKTNSGLASDTMYDVFRWNNAGTQELEFVAWTNDTTRATDLVRQDGVLVKSGTTTKRYVGTVKTNASGYFIADRGGIIGNIGAQQKVFNARMLEHRPGQVFDETLSWTYGTLAFRQARATAGNKCEYVVGLPADVDMSCIGTSSFSAVSMSGTVAVGHNSTTVPSGSRGSAGGVASVIVEMMARFCTKLNPGLHTFYWLESGNGSAGTHTWFGYAGVTDDRYQSGLSGHVTG